MHFFPILSYVFHFVLCALSTCSKTNLKKNVIWGKLIKNVGWFSLGFSPLFTPVCFLDFLTDLKYRSCGTSLVVQWLRLYSPSGGGPGSIPVQEVYLTCHN